MGYVAAAAAVVALVGGAVMSDQARSESNVAVDKQLKNDELIHSQKSLDAVTRLNQYLDAAAVENSTRGVANSSPSLGSEVIGAQRTSAKEVQNIDTEFLMQQENAAAEHRNISNKYKASLFSMLGQAASTGSAISSAYPSSGSGKKAKDLTPSAAKMKKYGNKMTMDFGY